MTMPATKDQDGRPIVFELYRGDTFRRTLTFLSEDAPMVLPTSGWSAQIRAAADSAAPLGTFTVDASAGATGVLELSMSAAATATMSDGVFDLQHVGTDTTTYIRGRVVVTGDVTRA